MIPFFEKLLAYNHHCNQQLYALFKTNEGIIPPKALLLLSHTINAHAIWNSRIHGQTPALAVWEIHEVDALQQLDQSNFENSGIILSHYDLNETIHYTNTKGISYSKLVKDILFHVINHSTYHRAQVASALKENGIEPIATDYIFYEPVSED